MNVSAALCNKCSSQIRKILKRNAAFMILVLVQSVGFLLTENFETSLPIEILSLTVIILLHHHAVGIIIVLDHHVVTYHDYITISLYYHRNYITASPCCHWPWLYYCIATLSLSVIILLHHCSVTLIILLHHCIVTVIILLHHYIITVIILLHHHVVT